MQKSIYRKRRLGLAIVVFALVFAFLTFCVHIVPAGYSKAVAQRNLERQRIENEIAISKAKADAEVIRITAEAQAEANRILSESLTDALVEYRKVEKWNGALSVVSGAGGAIVDIGPLSETAEEQMEG